jgi:hypothetical protein
MNSRPCELFKAESGSHSRCGLAGRPYIKENARAFWLHPAAQLQKWRCMAA